MSRRAFIEYSTPERFKQDTILGRFHLRATEEFPVSRSSI